MKKVIKKAKSGGSFPDLNKDGKVTKADVLVGRGVIKAKKGAALKKQAAVAIAMKKAGKTPKKAQLGGLFGKLAGKLGNKAGGSNMLGGMMGLLRRKKAEKQTPANTTTTMKKGGKMKKCRYGCK